MEREVIMPLLETDELLDYVKSNVDVMEWFDIDWTDGKEREVTEEEQAEIIDKVVAESTDGRLRDVLYDCFDTWAWEQFSEVLYSAIDNYVGDEIARILNERSK